MWPHLLDVLISYPLPFHTKLRKLRMDKGYLLRKTISKYIQASTTSGHWLNVSSTTNLIPLNYGNHVLDKNAFSKKCGLNSGNKYLRVESE